MSNEFASEKKRKNLAALRRKVKALCDETPWNRGDINSICFEENTLEAGKYSETNKDLENFPVCIVWLKRLEVA